MTRTLDFFFFFAGVAMAIGANGGNAMRMDLATLLRNREQQQLEAPQKRTDTVGNPCPSAEKPFPCKTGNTCIPMAYVCDDNIDCLEDGYDEEAEVCTAAHRPPFDEIRDFLESEKHWIMPMLFGDKSQYKVAHGLAVSQTVDDFKRRVGLSSHEIANLRDALKAVKEGNEAELEMLGMPHSSWNEVSYIFSKLIKSGFTA
ncbi:hypothetical protein CAPTEDRAFT_223337 [Capitella teleta]|uniref:Prohormone-4 n=1 Tax=Capitella teleta TaxID=283909 RepID=R7T4U5_CAPTE|nr:hypothetical protein CAPTEDRAFT_223337 [Capitella teleta]|eukprot:ELT88122.1 hypothetical protein CAPTEDRAFT_223337 [Capitella teleta]